MSFGKFLTLLLPYQKNNFLFFFVSCGVGILPALNLYFPSSKQKIISFTIFSYNLYISCGVGILPAHKKIPHLTAGDFNYLPKTSSQDQPNLPAVEAMRKAA